MFVSAAKGTAFQRRATTNGSSLSTPGSAVVAPYWVRLSRIGATFTAYTSADGSAWSKVGTQTITMGATIAVGLAVTSHRDGPLATATFDHVTVSTFTTMSEPELPEGWTSQDVGAASGGNVSFDPEAGAFTVTGAGADIWGTADAFRFALTTLSGDGEISARVASVQNVDPWTKAGVMICETLAAGSAQASMFVSAGKGTAFQRRVAADGLSTNTAGTPATAPYWVKLSRVGTSLTAFVSADGAAWIQVGTETIAMQSTVDVGLAVTSHHAGLPATATFDHVQVAAY
jgi:regulation of enolase protein 1 (concanavalin A-like superfamily)